MKRTKDGWAGAQHVDSFATAELVFPQASVIGLALSHSGAAAGMPGHGDQPFRFLLSAARARALAKDLLALADEIDGTAATHQ